MQPVTKKINDIVVRPIEIVQQTTRLKGSKIFSSPFFTCFICAMRRSGKTNLIYNIIKQVASKRTTAIIIIGSTVNKDATWKAITEFLRENKYRFFTAESLTSNGESLLSALLEELSGPDNSNYLVILDDLSSELKDPVLTCFIKKSRHYNIRLVISSQYYNDLLPAARQQLEYFILYRNIENFKLEEIHRNANIAVDFPTFLRIYRDATETKYNFLFIDKLNDEMRKNFSEIYEIA